MHFGQFVTSCCSLISTEFPDLNTKYQDKLDEIAKEKTAHVPALLRFLVTNPLVSPSNNPVEIPVINDVLKQGNSANFSTDKSLHWTVLIPSFSVGFFRFSSSIWQENLPSNKHELSSMYHGLLSKLYIISFT